MKEIIWDDIERYLIEYTPCLSKVAFDDRFDEEIQVCNASFDVFSEYYNFTIKAKFEIEEQLYRDDLDEEDRLYTSIKMDYLENKLALNSHQFIMERFHHLEIVIKKLYYFITKTKPSRKITLANAIREIERIDDRYHFTKLEHNKEFTDIKTVFAYIFV